MSGETDLQTLIREMRPELHPGEFVYCTVDSLREAVALNPLGLFQEAEAITVMLTRQQAEAAALPYSTVCAWITLTIHSSLEAVGLTAAVAAALTKANISCNVVAAYYHDHLFIPIQAAQRALEVLIHLSQQDQV